MSNLVIPQNPMLEKSNVNWVIGHLHWTNAVNRMPLIMYILIKVLNFKIYYIIKL